MSGTGAACLWDVAEECLDEAEFLLEQWQRAARSPIFTLAELQESVERRLVAHLDALAVGGEVVAQRLLWPALEGGSPPARVAAAALALLLDSEASVRDRVLRSFTTSSAADARDGLRLAFELTARTDVDELLRKALYEDLAPEMQASVLAA